MLMTPKHTLKEIENMVFSAAHKIDDRFYRTQCGCEDGCSRCDGTGYILNRIGLFLQEISKPLSKEINNNYESLKAENEKLRGLLQRVIDVVYESEGVSGYHLNGDIASWGEFEVFNEIEQALNMTKLLLSLENAVKVG